MFTLLKDRLISLFKEQNNLIRSSRESERVTASKEKKKTREEKLEKKDSGKSDKVLDKVAAPFENFFDKIMNFFKFILLGGFLEGLLKVIKDPQILLKPIQDIVNNIIGFFNGIIQWIDDNIVGAFRTLIDYINGGLKNITNTLNNIIKTIPNWMPFKPDPINDPPVIPQIPNLPQIPQATFAEPNIQTQNTGGKVINVNQGNNITNTVINAKDLKFKSGGKVGTDSGITITGLGPDTQLIAAQPGEIVMNRAAVDGYGADNLLKLNSLFGGSNANNPKSVGSGAATAMSSGGILQGAKSIIGMGKGVGDQCANTTRAALRSAGHPAAKKRTQKGDLDTPKGTGYNAPSFAASFGGTDMGQVITNKSQIKAGDIILWRADRNLGGNLNKGAITHVGIAADDGLKNQYDHNRSRGFHYRPHWHSSGGTSWFAGVRLGGKGGSVPPSPGENGGGASIGNVGDSRLDLQSSTQPSIPQYDTSKPYAGGLYTIGGGANMGAAGQQQSSAAGANQSPVPTFSADDPMNPSLLVVKSIYNIVG